jgi:alanine dehydrogenase
MVVGVPREIMTHEYRVSVTPAGARELLGDGHRVLVEHGAGEGSDFPDAEYEAAGAALAGKDALFSEAELIVKVKEPVAPEYGFFRNGQALFTFLHLAPNRELIDMLLEKEITAIGYETLEDGKGLPLLKPMSAIAGRMSPLVAAQYLQRPLGGRGVLASGVPGVPPAYAVILGGGTVGENAARIALGLGMRVSVLNRGIGKLERLDEMYQGRVHTLAALEDTIAGEVREADILIGAVLVAGARAPRLVSRRMVQTMKRGAVIVDVSVDQGGCIETIRPTTHDDPVYEAEGVMHYAVTNMPGAYPRTATLALTNSTLPFVRRLAALGTETAIREDRALRSAVNTWRGSIVHAGLAESAGYTPGVLT